MMRKRMLFPVYMAALPLLLAGAQAFAGIAVIASSQLELGSLRLEQLQRLFLGKTITANGLALEPVDLPGGTLRDEFYRKLMGRDNAQMRAHWSQMVFTGRGEPPDEAADARDMLKRVANNPGQIGYVDTAVVDGSVRVLYVLP